MSTTTKCRSLRYRVCLGLLSGLTVFAGGCASLGFSKEPVLLKPAALKPGDTIAFVAPAGPLDQERMERAKARLEQRGYHVQVPENLYRVRGYLAGDDQARADELMAMFKDPNVNAIFPGTGGYGTTRMLDLLDYDVIRAHPKVFIGFSDITGLHLAIHQKTGLMTFHTPNTMWGLGSKSNLHPLAEKYFWRTLETSAYEAQGEQRKRAGFAYEWNDEYDELQTVSPGRTRGRLIGGNLSLIAATMGTPYEIDTRGRILFFEDVDERPYRIDRFLAQLKSAGKFDEAAGVLICHFTGCEETEGRRSLTLSEVLDDYFKDCGIPVVKYFPVGHMRQNVTLPEGGLVELDADRCRVRLLEDPVVP